MAQQEYFEVFLTRGQAFAGLQVDEQSKDMQDKVDIGVHGPSISGTKVFAQVGRHTGRIIAHYRVATAWGLVGAPCRAVVAIGATAVLFPAT